MSSSKADAAESAVVVRRSARRRKTISARREGYSIVVMVPAGMRRSVEERAVRETVKRLLDRAADGTPVDAESLGRRAEALAVRYLDPFTDAPVRPAGVRWVSNQERRWGSCTPATGQIRLSDRMSVMPDWVLDYVLLHELAHLVEANHTARFHQILERFPRAVQARGFLEGWQAALSRPRTPR